jgi:hypothetical protein
MGFDLVEYFGMPVPAVFRNGAWHYQNTQTRELVPFVFQQQVRPVQNERRDTPGPHGQQPIGRRP